MIKISFSMFSGNTKSVTMPIKNDNTGASVNLTGASGTFSIAEFPNPKPEQVICSGPVILYDATGGIIQFVIEPEQTAGKHGTFPFDVKITFADGVVQTVYSGWVEIKAVVNA